MSYGITSSSLAENSNQLRHFVRTNEFVDDDVDVFVEELPVTALKAAFIAAAALNASALVEKLKLHKLLKLNEDDEWEDAAAADKADWKCGNDEDKK